MFDRLAEREECHVLWVMSEYIYDVIAASRSSSDLIWSQIRRCKCPGLHIAYASLLGRNATTSDARYKYDSSKTSMMYAKNSGIYTTDTFTELGDDNDASSQVQL